MHAEHVSFAFFGRHVNIEISGQLKAPYILIIWLIKQEQSSDKYCVDFLLL